MCCPIILFIERSTEMTNTKLNNINELVMEINKKTLSK